MSPTSERWADGPSVLESVWRYRWLVLAVTAAFGLAGFLLSQGQPAVYEASTQLYLSDPGSSDVFGQGNGPDLDRYVPQQTDRATSTLVLTRAAELLDDGASPGQLGRQVSVEGEVEVGTLTITAEDGSARGAAAAANAVATAYQDTVREERLERADRAASELEVAEEEIEGQIEALDDQSTAAPPGGEDDALGNPRVDGQIGVLAQRLVEIDALTQQLRVDARLFGSGVEFVEEAQPPSAPIAPTPRRTAAATAVLGGLLAAALAYWLSSRGRRVASRDEPAEVLGVPLLGTLPTYAVADQGTLRERTSLDPRTAEAYRFVYSSLEVTLREVGARSVVMTSASPSTGKTETALQVAMTAHRRGQDVLLIDADLRMRGLTRFLRAQRTPGLLDLAEDGQRTPESLVARYPLDDHRELAVLTTGQVVGDGSEQLSETWFGRAFDQLVTGHDLTVVDSPPLLAVADTATIAGYTDAIVLVVREGSDLDDLERVRQRLRFVGQRLVGYVYLSPTALDDTAFDYGLVRERAWQSRGARPAARGRETSPPASPSSAPTDERGEYPDGVVATPSRESSGSPSHRDHSDRADRPRTSGAKPPVAPPRLVDEVTRQWSSVPTPPTENRGPLA